MKAEKNIVLKISAFVMLFFGVNVYFAFATDTYCTFKKGFEASAADMVSRNGRPIIGLMYELHHLSGLSNKSFYYISTVLALVFLGVSIWLFQRLLARHGVRENIRILLSCASIANIFIIEYFMYIEKCGFMLAILFDISAVWLVERFFDKKKKSDIALAMIMLTLAVFTYQGTVALFVILSIPFAFKYSKKFTEYVINMFWLGISYAVAVMLDMLAFKFVFKSSRISDQIDLIANIKKVIKGLVWYGISTFDILPRYMFLVLAIIVFAAAVCVAFCQKEKWLSILNILAIILAACIVSTATILQGSGFWATRTVYPIASVIGALTVNLFINQPDISDGDKRVRRVQTVTVLVILILLICQYFSFNKIYIDKYKVNVLDEYRYDYIGQAIEEYQESSGNEIKKIAFYTDAERTSPAYFDLYDQGSLVVSAFYRSWSELTALNYYLDTSYEKADQSDEYVEYFASKDWNQLSQEQLIFDGDTLHLCIY